MRVKLPGLHAPLVLTLSVLPCMSYLSAKPNSPHLLKYPGAIKGAQQGKEGARGVTEGADDAGGIEQEGGRLGKDGARCAQGHDRGAITARINHHHAN